MDKEEARLILHRKLAELRSSSYADLAALVGSDLHIEQFGPSGVEYQIEVQVLWDDPHKPADNLRVIVSIDDGGFFAAIKPLSADFIKSPAGNFIGE